MKTTKQFLICVYANKFALLGYIFLMIGISILFVTGIYQFAFIYFMLLPGASLLLLTSGGYDTFIAYKKALGMIPEKIKMICSFCKKMEFCVELGYKMALYELENPKPL